MIHPRLLPWPLALTLALLAMPGSSHAAAKNLSPSEALKQADLKLGTGWANFPRTPQDRMDLGEDKTLAPYLYVAGGDQNTDRLPLKETHAKVQISGVIAQVKVTQVFENDGKKPIEAVYVFPGSTRSAVHGMRMTIGERTVVAKIEKKAEARAQYEQARREGKRASLLEQSRPNVFTMNVANLMPGDKIVVDLDYSELLVPENGDYEFVYPAVVGPRFTGGEAKGDKSFAANPHLPAGQAEPYRFGIDVQIDAGLPIQSIESQTHKLSIKRPSPQSAEIGLAQSGGGNKDFVLRYRLAGGKIETGLLLYEAPDGQKYFLLMLEPPVKPSNKQIPPREYVFLLDVSGSMHGYPLNTSKALMKRLLTQLRVNDLFNIAFFSGSSWMLSPDASLPATESNIQMAMQMVDKQQGGGGTRLMDGLRTAYKLPRSDNKLSRSVIAVTDGYVMVENQAFKFIREHLNEANVFAFGIGSSVNRALIEGMARAGQGEPYIVFGPEKAGAVAERLGETIREPVLSQISYQFEGFEAREVAPIKLPDLLARRPLVLFGKYKGKATGTIVIKGHTGQGNFEQRVELSKFQPSEHNAPIRTLWARKWVSFLMDELTMSGGAQELVDAITDLGLSYDLLTNYTSFVAVDSEVVNQGGEGDKVRQALPMPEGVSNSALGGSSSGMVMAKKTRSSLSAADALAGAPRTKSLAPPSPRPARAEESKSEAYSGRELRRAPGGSQGFGGLGTRGSGMGAGGIASKESSLRDGRLGKKGGTLRFMISKALPSGLKNDKALVAALEKRLAKLAGKCGNKGSSVELELSFDANGRVIKVKLLSGDRALGACLSAGLKGFATGKAQSPGGKLILGLRTMRL